MVGQASSPTVFHAMRRGATHRALSNIEVPRVEQLMPCVHCLTEAVLLETCLLNIFAAECSPSAQFHSRRLALSRFGLPVRRHLHPALSESPAPDFLALPTWPTSAQTLAPRPFGKAPLLTFQLVPKAGTLPIGAMSRACPAASRRAVSAPALLCTHMVYGPEYCYECEMWLRGGRQYWEHLRSRLHKKRSRRHRAQRGHRRSFSCPPRFSTYEMGRRQ